MASQSSSDDHRADDEARRRFREALERKRGHGGGNTHPHDPGGSVSPHGSPKPQRMFRRKSG